MSDNISGMRDPGFRIGFRQDAGYREIACVCKVIFFPLKYTSFGSL